MTDQTVLVLSDGLGKRGKGEYSGYADCQNAQYHDRKEYGHPDSQYELLQIRFQSAVYAIWRMLLLLY